MYKQERTSGMTLTKHVARLWVEVGQPLFTRLVCCAVGCVPTVGSNLVSSSSVIPAWPMKMNSTTRDMNGRSTCSLALTVHTVQWRPLGEQTFYISSDRSWIKHKPSGFLQRHRCVPAVSTSVLPAPTTAEHHYSRLLLGDNTQLLFLNSFQPTVH
jgi:hypothetical protein